MKLFMFMRSLVETSPEPKGATSKDPPAKSSSGNKGSQKVQVVRKKSDPLFDNEEYLKQIEEKYL